MEKNRAIEFYRFLAIMCIAVFHFNIQFTGEFCFLKGGYLGVEFFFILSGFLLMKTYRGENHPKTAHEFWLRRVSRLYPAYILTMVLFILFDIFVRNYITSFADLVSRLGDEIWDLLLLQNIGIPGVFAYEGSLWFLSSLSVNLYLIYYLLLKHGEIYTNFLILALCVVVYGYIGKQFGSLSMQEEWLGGVIYGGLMRGFLDMSLGVVAYNLMIVFRRWPSSILSLLEVISLLFCLKAISEGFCVEDFKVLVLFPVLIASTMTGKSIWVRLLNLQISDFAGEISFEIYLNHLLISTILTMFWKGIGYKKALTIYVMCIILLAIAMHIFIQTIQRLFQKIKHHYHLM